MRPNRPPEAAVRFSSSSARRISARSASLRRTAARPAASASMLTRNSSIASTSIAVTMADGSMRKGEADSAGGGVSTKVPMPWRVSTRPLACRRDSASRTTVRLTPSVAMISDSVGSLSPGRSVPWRMLSVRLATASSASVRPRRRSGVGAKVEAFIG
ncbi:hypothetical protein OJJOAM_000831 [Cupriavidus sp. H18C1]